MARKTRGSNIDLSTFDSPGARVIDSALGAELQSSYGEYAYSVIHSRALPDVRDGMKPVHRRIMFAMNEMGLRPDRGYVKSARVVGDVMGRYHPHGDSAIYDAMVRLAQDFAQNAPLVDGHGNFGSQDDGPAASRYTEARMSPEAMLLVSEIAEDTVDFRPNYDGSLQEPTVLPAAFPVLLVNGASGIAVGMSTNMIPHNLGEVVGAARHLIAHPDATLDEIMAFVPGPDLPTGGILLGLDQVRAAYETGRGVVRMRARVEIGPLEGSRGRQAITAVEMPYGIGPEKVIEAIKKETTNKRLQGIADVKDLTDMNSEGTRLVIECKVGVNPQALLADLYRLTPLESSFGIINNVLVGGRPQVLGLVPLLTEFLAHRYDVVTRRTRFRLRRATERRHIVEGLLIALDNLDLVVRIIRSSADAAEAKRRLVAELAGVQVSLGGQVQTRGLDEEQAQHILDMPLRRLVALEVEALRAEWAALTATITDLQRILDDEAVLKSVVSEELAAVAKAHTRARRTTLVDGDLKEVLAASKPAGPLEVADDPCQVLLSATGLLARTAVESEEASEARRRNGRIKHDAVRSVAHATARGQVLLVTNQGRAVRTSVLPLPVLPVQSGTVTLRGSVPASELVDLRPGETVIGVAPLGDGTPGVGLALGTRQGRVKITRPEWLVRTDEFDVIGLDPADEVVGASWVTDPSMALVFVTSDASLLRFDAGKVRPQGLSGAGIDGIRLAADATVLFFGAVSTSDSDHGQPLVVTSTGGGVKVTPLVEYPEKGRATGGVRAMRFLKTRGPGGGESQLALAWVGARPAAATATGDPLDLPAVDPRRDGSGETMPGPAVIGHLVERA